MRSTQKKHLFKHKVNGSSLARRHFPVENVSHSLETACSEEEVEGLSFLPEHSNSHSLWLASLPRVPWGLSALKYKAQELDKWPLFVPMLCAFSLSRFLSFHVESLHFLRLFNILAWGKVLIVYYFAALDLSQCLAIHRHSGPPATPDSLQREFLT